MLSGDVVNSVPEPTGMILFGIGAVAVAVTGIRRKIAKRG